MRPKMINAMPDVPGLSEEEVEEFLHGGNRPAHVATVGDKSSPSIYPVWYYYEDGRLYFFTGKDTKKAREIERTRKVYFCIDSEEPPYRGVKGMSRASAVDDPAKSRSIGEKIVVKYMGSLKARGANSIIEGIKSGSEFVLELVPTYYTTWDYGKLS